jgi:hypothetical protein
MIIAPGPQSDPKARYQERLACRRELLAVEQARDQRLSMLRLFVFLSLPVLAVFASHP